ncbi:MULTISPECIES: hypothetical protein [Streptomyces]|uniref:hypothetical protein n=1 Tax=Streptomyces TaxID=1883 RepID=UPI003211EB35
MTGLPGGCGRSRDGVGRGGEEQSAHSSGQGRLGQLNPHRRPRPESREYAGTSPAGPRFGGTTGTSPYTSTTFQYTLDDQQTRVTGPDGSQWTYGYDLFGRKISADDLDKGLTRLSYDQLDRLTQTTDSRGTSPPTTLSTASPEPGPDRRQRPTN